ncbi:MAG: aminoacyl-tRNA hydrolase [Alphaproteobacteria bacterium MedPE-SWcel]|nr:MAG: aminoacyl-tRNA hydrolase [Alphaproteobacteria bacterium MedPE-SWcel]
MKLLVGLGNPGAKYAGNRHNIGFMALDQIASDHGFSPWKSKFQAQMSDGTTGGEKLILLKPQTFMNNSGQSVGEALRFFKLTPSDVVVFHDELDLAPGKCRVKQGGGHAGHNGLRSIHAHIGADYMRVRLGIGHPGHKDAVAGYVLHDFPKADRDGWLDDVLRGISDGVPCLAQGDSGKFMNAVALRVAPARSSTGTEGPSGKKTQRSDAGAETGPAKSAQARAPATKPAAPPDTGDTRNPMQKLLDRFK